MMRKYSQWEYRIPSHGEEEFCYIGCWSGNRPSERDFLDHESAAKQVGENLTDNDPDYYKTLMEEGIEAEIKSPGGEIKLMRVGGYTDFVYTTSDVSS